MERILSKDEINALLKTVPQGKAVKEVKDRKVTEYDLKRYSGIAREYFPIFRETHENFSFLVERLFCDKLGFNIKFNMANQDVSTLGEFVASCSNPSYVAVFRLEPAIGDIVVNIEPALAHVLVDILFGGDGKIPKSPEKLTLIEESFISQASCQFLELLRDAWRQFISVDLKVFSEGINPLIIAPVDSPDNVLVSTFNFFLGGDQKATAPLTMRISYSYGAARSFISSVKLHSKTKYSGAGGEFRKEIEKVLMSKDVSIEVYLGESSVSVGELLELEVGDVIKLDTDVKDELILCAEEKPKWFGKPGVCRKKIVFSVTQKYEEEGGKDNESTKEKN